MKYNLFIFSLFTIIINNLIILSYSKYLGLNANGIKLFTIDLNSPPEERFTEITIEFRESIIESIERYLYEVPQYLRILIKPLAGLLWKTHPEYYKEVIGIAKVLEYDEQILLMFHYSYDFSAFCTSVIAKDKDGKIIHSRNLDFLFSDTMRKNTYEALFIKDGKILFKTVMFAGLNSIFTGQGRGFAISLNERRPSIRTNIFNLFENIFNTFYGLPLVSNVIRDTLNECDNYDCAFKKLTETHQIAPSYYALSGIRDYEGVIISKASYKVANLDYLSESRWFISQTNDDHWTGVCDLRCKYVLDTMNQIGKDDITYQKIIDMLKGWPSNNIQSIYNTLFINSEYIFETELISNDKPSP